MTTIAIADGVQVACPDDAGMTPYVLAEQGDWFEDEIRFVREILAPDTAVVDVGANFGVYTLAAARRAPRGRVWAYEPCGATADWLARGIAANGFGHVTLRRCALSDGAGSGRLRIAASPEMNALAAGDGAEDAGDFEDVELTTLDAERAALCWPRIDFVKIDAEGHECAVIDGGQGFFTGDSPLVMCEIKAGAAHDLRAAERLIALGYAPYRLVPGLLALAPQDLAAPIDTYQLNLFLCRPERAAALHEAGRLATVAAQDTDGAAAADTDAGGAAAWPAYLDALPHGVYARDAWRRNAGRRIDGRDDYERVLELYARARDPARAIDARWRALRGAFVLLRSFIETKMTGPRMLSYARIAAECGERAQAVNALAFIAGNAAQLSEDEVAREPWLAPAPGFDTIAPRGALHEFATAATLDAWERLRVFSGWISDPNLTIAVTDRLKALGYLSAEMRRRRRLARERLNRQK